MSAQFFENVDIKQRMAYMAIIAYMERMNTEPDENNLMIFDELAKLYNLSKSETDQALATLTKDEVLLLAREIEHPVLALVLIRELFYLGYEYGDLSDDEILFISNVGLALSIPIEKLEQISSWVIRSIELEEEGALLFSGEEDDS